MQDRNNVVVVRPDGRLTADMAGRLRVELLRAAADDPGMVVCDLRRGVRDAEALDILADVVATVRRWPACPVVVLGDDRTLRALQPTAAEAGFALAADLDGAPHARVTPPLDRARIRLQPTLHAPGVARRYITAVLQGWGRLDDVAVAALILDELVTNAVLHARTDTDVCLTRRGVRVELTVADRSDSPLVRRRPGEGDEHGHGLVLVDALASRWGALPRHPEGKVVWAVIEP